MSVCEQPKVQLQPEIEEKSNYAAIDNRKGKLRKLNIFLI